MVVDAGTNRLLPLCENSTVAEGMCIISNPTSECCNSGRFSQLAAAFSSGFRYGGGSLGEGAVGVVDADDELDAAEPGADATGPGEFGPGEFGSDAAGEADVFFVSDVFPAPTLLEFICLLRGCE